MAKNREPEPQESSESESRSTESGSDTDSESEQQTQPPNPTPTPQNRPTATSDSDSESLSGSESGSESDSESESSDPEPENPNPNPTPPLQISPAKPSAVGVKRGGGKVLETPDVKKPKKIETLVKKDGKSEGGDGKLEDSSKRLFQRVFSEDDEIGLLKGMLDFIAKKKSDPVGNIDEFLEFVKKSLHLDVTKAQLLNKIKRLRVKYKGNASKVKDGQDVKISKPHERETYALSKRIWGVLDGEVTSGDGGVESKKVNGSVVKKCVNKNVSRGEDVVTLAALTVNDDDNKAKSASAGSVGVADVGGGVSMNLTLEERIMREEIRNVDTATQKELGKRLSEIEVAELELCARRCEFVARKARLMIAAKKNEL